MSRPTRLLKAEGVRLARPQEDSNGAGLPGPAGGTPTQAEPGGSKSSSGAGGLLRAEAPERGEPPSAARNGQGAYRTTGTKEAPSGAAWRLRLRDRRRLEGARQQARRLLEQAQASARQLEQRAREDGYRKGFEQGLAQGREEAMARALKAVRQVVERLEEVVRQAEDERRRVLAQLESGVVELALAVAEKVVRQKIAQGPEITLAVLRSVLAEHLPAASGRVRVHVHPSEYRQLQDESGRWPLDVAGPVEVEFLPDARVEPGGCMVESELGLFDAGLQTRLSLVGMALMDGVSDAGH